MSFLNGRTMVRSRPFTNKDPAKPMHRDKPNLFPGVPAMYLALRREAEHQKYDLSSIKVCISGSAPMPLEVQRRFAEVSGGKVVEGYGVTEGSPVTHCNPGFG